jgi:hypothetical protein
MNEPAILQIDTPNKHHHKYHVIEQSEAVTSHLKLIRDLDRKAADHIQQRDSALEEVNLLRAEWKAIFEKFELLSARVAGAKDALKFAEDHTTLRREKFLNFVGIPGTTNLDFLTFATELASKSAGVELIKLGLARAEKELAEHRKELLEFGRGYDMPADILKQFEGSIG